jgi:aspartate carbamoyltransferase catalytic subunit
MRHLATLDDLSNFEIEQIFRLADQMRTHFAAWSGFCKGKILATLFYEPSTRTRLSFESAMGRLDGRALGFADPYAASVAKGETIADTARMVTNYADLIVVRHNWAGAARVMAQYSNIPVVNGGDGSHAHPTQGLADLYTILQRKGRIEGLTVGVCGDLRYGRAAHSLALVVARFGGKLIHIAPEGFHMPDWMLMRLKHVYGQEPSEADQLTDVIGELDVIYVTRLQAERLPASVNREAVQDSYLVNAQIMEGAKPDAMIMHPLPRVNELSYELDDDPRAAYFEQSANGVPIRMALIASLVGLEQLVLTQPPRRNIFCDERPCKNPECVLNHERYLKQETEIIGKGVEIPVCAYCSTMKSER